MKRSNLDLLDEIYYTIKKYHPNFEKKSFGMAKIVFYGQSGGEKGFNGIGFRYEDDRVYVKSNLITGTLSDRFFLLPSQFGKAKEAIYSLYNIPIQNNPVENKTNSELFALDVQLRKKKHIFNVVCSEIEDFIYYKYFFDLDNKIPLLEVCADKSNHNDAIIKIKHCYPLLTPFNGETEKGLKLYDFESEKKTNFVKIVEDVSLIYLSKDVYALLSSNVVTKHVFEYLDSFKIAHSEPYAMDGSFWYKISDKYETRVFKRLGMLYFVVSGDRVSRGPFRYNENNVDTVLDQLFGTSKKIIVSENPDVLEVENSQLVISVGDNSKIKFKANKQVTWSKDNSNIVLNNNGTFTAIAAGVTNVTITCGKTVKTIKVIVEEKRILSENANKFIKDIDNFPSNPTKEDYDEVFDLYDSLDEKECNEPSINEKYQFIKELYQDSEKKYEPDAVRFVYASKSFLKSINDLDSEHKEALNAIRQSLSTLKRNDLNKYLLSKQLVYIDGYLKIRVKNGSKHRILFCFGDTFGKSNKDIYLFDYNKTHDFSNIRNLNPSNQQYSIWKSEKDRIEIPPLTEKQESISASIDKPLICTGCAGSGKTLISVYKYVYLLDNRFNGSVDVPEEDIIYVTYNDNAKRNAVKQLLEIVNKANAKTIYGYFYDIAKPDLANMTYVDEEKFAYWWNNEITDYSFKNKINNIVKANPIKYVYTFFRGLFKGSMYRWELDPKAKHLSHEQFMTLMQNEGVEKQISQLIYEICKQYQSYLEKNNYYDDNDLARIASRRLNIGLAKKYGHIIIDEVQDLTEVQLDAIVKSSKDKRKLYFFGDQNQSINPTLFDIDFIKMCLMKNDSSIDSNDIYELRSSYRFGPLLARYVNELVKLKRKWIGSQAIEETESSNKNPEKNRWAGTTSNPKTINDILVKASNSSNAIIVVPDNQVKETLKRKFGTDFVKRVTTIYDSKGLEWDYVVLYNMLKFNEDKYLEMMHGKGKHSTLHRMIFNQYYVGCTRAQTCFTVLEENLNKEVNDAIIGKLQKIHEGTVGLYIQEENDSSSWYVEANRLFDAGVYDLALSAFEKAGLDYNEEPKMKISKIFQDQNEKSDINNANFCRENKFYKEAAIIYQNAGNNNLSQLMNLYSGINVSAENIWEIINNEKLNSEDMELIVNNGYFKGKTEEIFNKLNELKSFLK